MKRTAYFFLAIAVTLIAGPSISAAAQDRMPDVSVRTIDNGSVSALSILNDSVPVILSFWATYCKPCIQELGTISDEYEDWLEQAKFKVVAVSIDDARSSAKAAAFAEGSNWPFTVLLDPNGDLKRGMNVASVPTVFILDRNGKVVYTHNGYTVGSEEKLLEIVKGLQQ
jgi:cytochrome c biogenesis protein CcmG/thiol:disulfide interchange protein DsbE